MDSFDKGWFVLQTYSGYENKVKENLLQRNSSVSRGTMERLSADLDLYATGFGSKYLENQASCECS